MNFFVYGLNAVYNCFMPLYLTEYFGNIAKGTLLSVGPFVTMVAPAVWGVLTDKAKTKNRVLIMLCIFATASFVSVYFAGTSFALTAVLLGAYMFFASTYGASADTISIESTSGRGINYGPIRVFGTLGYGLIAVFASLSDNYDMIFVLYACAAFAAAVFVALSPKVKGHSHGRKKMDFRPLLKDRRLTLILFINAVVMFCFSFYSNFMPSYITKDLGLPSYVWGINVFATLTMEIPMFFFYDRIFRKFSLRTLLISVTTVTVLRCAVLSFVSTVPGILATAFLTGSWVTLASYIGTYYITNNIPKGIIASGLSLLYIVSNGVPKVLAGFLGGVFVQSFGMKTSYIVCGACCAAAAAAAFAYPKKDKENVSEEENI